MESKTITLYNRWEYKVMRIPDADGLIGFLNKQGEDGWELANMKPTHLGVFCVFKRAVIINRETDNDTNNEFVTIPVDEYKHLKRCEQDCIDKCTKERQDAEREIYEKAINSIVPPPPSLDPNKFY